MADDPAAPLGRPRSLQPGSQFPEQALQESIQTPPKATAGGIGGQWMFTWNLASAADAITPWGKQPKVRDRQLRDFWPTETYIAGAVASLSFRNATLDWEMKSPSDALVTATTDMLLSAIAGDTFGWVPFIERVTQDLLTQDNGAFIELIRDPGTDADSRFKAENAPVIGIAHLDAGQCIRTGDPNYPVIYTDRSGEPHKMPWYSVIPFSDYPSSIERMNGVGYCAVSRALRMAQIMKSIFMYKDEKITGRHYKQIHFVSGVSRQEIKDEMQRGQEEANNTGLVKFILPAVLASLDPEKPVSTATIDLAALPDGFNLDEEMRWYIAGLALAFGVDYQEFAPLPGGNIGSSQQSMILHRKASGKNPAVFMRILSEGLRNYGAFPRNVTMRFNDKDEQEELEKQEVRTKAAEEAAIIIRSKILTPAAVRADLKKRGIYPEEIIDMVPELYGESGPTDEEGLPIQPDPVTGQVKKNPVGQRGGNTIREDAKRQETGKPNPRVGDRLRKFFGG